MFDRRLLSRRLGALLVLGLFFCSVSRADNPAPQTNTGRWQIYRADLSPASEMQGATQRTNMNSTILLDSVTGDTWLLWPSDAGGKRFYTWVPLDRQKPTPK